MNSLKQEGMERYYSTFAIPLSREGKGSPKKEGQPERTPDPPSFFSGVTTRDPSCCNSRKASKV